MNNFPGTDGSRIHDEIPRLFGNFLKGTVISAIVVGVLTLGMIGICSGVTHSSFVHILDKTKTSIVLVGFTGSVVAGIAYAIRKDLSQASLDRELAQLRAKSERTDAEKVERND